MILLLIIINIFKQKIVLIEIKKNLEDFMLQIEFKKYAILIIALGFFIFLMSIGIIFSNKSLKGSCGNSCDCTDIEKKKCPTYKLKSIITHKN